MKHLWGLLQVRRRILQGNITASSLKKKKTVLKEKKERKKKNPITFIFSSQVELIIQPPALFFHFFSYLTSLYPPRKFMDRNPIKKTYTQLQVKMTCKQKIRVYTRNSARQVNEFAIRLIAHTAMPRGSFSFIFQWCGGKKKQTFIFNELLTR